MSMFNFGYNRRPTGLFSQLDDPANIAAIAQRRVPMAMPQEDDEEERRRRGSGLLSNLGLRIFGDDNRFFGQQEDGSTFRDRMMMAGLALQGDGRGAVAYRQGLQERQQAQLQAQAEAERQRLERERIVEQGRALGLQGEELSRFFLAPEEVRNEFYNSRMNPEPMGAPTTRTVNRGGETVTEQWNPQTQQFEEIGRAPRWNPNAQPLVTFNEGEQSNPYAEAYRAATEEHMQTILTEVGPAAERRAIQLDRLEDLLSANETGLGAAARLFASDFGLEIGENVGELQAARALINSLVPELRPPNSGTFTDADARLARESLPRLINTPGGNALILSTLRRINDYDRQLYRLTQQVGRGDITEQQYNAAVAALANPLDPVRDQLGGGSAGRPQRPRLSDYNNYQEYLDAVDAWINGGGDE